MLVVGFTQPLSQNSFANAFRLLAAHKVKANLLAADNFGNIYTADNNKLFKYGTDGKFLYPYEEFRYGKIGSIDATNPLKVMVWYPDFMTIVMLDRFLAPLNTYNFSNLGYQNITAIASSVDGRIWYYDNLDFTLKKVDESGRLFRNSQPLNQILDAAPNPNFIIERDNRVYMNDPEIGILVFDIFGGYFKTIPLKGLKKFQVLREQILYYEDNKMRAYDPLTFQTSTLPLPDTVNVKFAIIEKERLGVLTNEEVKIYSY